MRHTRFPMLAMVCSCAMSGSAFTQVNLTGGGTTTGVGIEALTTVRVAGNLDHVVFATHATGDFTRLFIVEKQGRIKVLNLKTGVLSATLFLDIDVLVGGGITNVTIVTGHCDGMIRDELGTSYRGVPIRYAFNPDYVNTGSVISLLVGAAYVTGPSVLVVESDLLYHPSFIEVALSEPSNTMLVADRSGSGDEVYICVTEDGCLDYLGKAATPELRERSLGEYAGMVLVSDEMLAGY